MEPRGLRASARSTIPTAALLVAAAFCLVCLASREAGAEDGVKEIPFLRGDANLDGRVTISDAVMIRRLLFLGDGLPCEDAADVDDDGRLTIADVVEVVLHLFYLELPETGIAPPYPTAALDVTGDRIFCDHYTVEPPERTDDTVRLGTVQAGPGHDVEIPVFISSSTEVEGYQLLIVYDPAVFTPLEPVEDALVLDGTLFEGRDTEPSTLRIVTAHPEHGVLSVGFVGHLMRSGFEVPAGENVLVAKIAGRVSPDAAPGTTVELRFTDDEASLGTKQLRTEFTYEGVGRYVSGVPRVRNGVLQIVGDLTFFVRGDANDDEVVDLSDAIFTLGYLFLGSAGPRCPDAADADDNGRIEITDAIRTLAALFGSGEIAFPAERPGLDPTPDRLADCRPDGGS